MFLMGLVGLLVRIGGGFFVWSGFGCGLTQCWWCIRRHYVSSCLSCRRNAADGRDEGCPSVSKESGKGDPHRPTRRAPP